MKLSKRFKAVALSTLMTVGFMAYAPEFSTSVQDTSLTVNAATLTLDDMPSEYEYAADWIWNNRISNEDSTGSKAKRYNVLFDQIVAGKGTLNYVVRWQSYKTLSLAQREGLEKVVEDGINSWTDYLVGYEDWPYNHVDVNIVGWAVLDRNCILDPQPDEVIYDNLITDYDSTYDTSNGVEEIPDKLPSAPEELWSFNYFHDRNHQYPGTRFDMYLWCTQGFPNIGGCGGDWGQRLSDNAYISMAESQNNLHVHVHEVGHGFGMTDFYGGEGESNGFPPGGFPGNGSSIMMAGSSTVITDFDGWMLRYMWSKISDESGRFDLANAQPETTEPATQPTTETTTTTIEETVPTETTVIAEPGGYISRDSLPDKTEYKIGEQLDLTGLKVTVTFFPGGATTNPDYHYNIYENVNPIDYPDAFTVETSEFNSTVPGTYTITVEYTDENAKWADNVKISFDVTVVSSTSDVASVEFTDTITAKTEKSITFAENGTFTFEGDYYNGDPQKNLSNYDVGDKIQIKMSAYPSNLISEVESITLIENSRLIKGDIDSSGTFTVADVIVLQKLLLGIELNMVPNWQAADMNDDGKHNVFDLCIMKRNLTQ